MPGMECLDRMFVNAEVFIAEESISNIKALKQEPAVNQP